jgi:hypothetical protein
MPWIFYGAKIANFFEILKKGTRDGNGDEGRKWGRGTERRSSVVEIEEDKGTRRWGDKGKMESEK